MKHASITLSRDLRVAQETLVIKDVIGYCEMTGLGLALLSKEPLNENSSIGDVWMCEVRNQIAIIRNPAQKPIPWRGYVTKIE